MTAIIIDMELNTSLNTGKESEKDEWGSPNGGAQGSQTAPQNHLNRKEAQRLLWGPSSPTVTETHELTRWSDRVTTDMNLTPGQPSIALVKVKEQESLLGITVIWPVIESSKASQETPKACSKKIREHTGGLI